MKNNFKRQDRFLLSMMYSTPYTEYAKLNATYVDDRQQFQQTEL